jgi:anthranilate/para-aminobenzoate synthase component I
MSGPEIRVERRPLPPWSPLDLAAALGRGPVALLDGLIYGGRRCTLVAWAPAAYAPSVTDAQRAATAIPLPPEAPSLLGAAVGNLNWDGSARFWVPGAAALFAPAGGELWLRGSLPQVAPGMAAAAPLEGRGEARPLWGRAAYCAAVREAQAEMAAGRLEKVILSVPFTAPCEALPTQVYRRLTEGDPPGLRFLFDEGAEHGALLGVSPEPLVSLTERRAEMHLLAGTRPAGEGYERELLSSVKDHAEHAVAVEQARRDLLAVCAASSVSVDAFMALERHPGLLHLASHLSGLLREGVTPAALVDACFPAGTVGGVPRAEAVALINRLEPAPRDWYAGAVGALLPDGDLQLWLTIRSLSLKGGTACVRTGAGLVAESVPEAEWQECLNKAGRTLAAIGAEVVGDDRTG